MLSYLLQNREVNGVRTVERFRQKPELADDPATFMLIDRATRSGHTDTILFNIGCSCSIFSSASVSSVFVSLIRWFSFCSIEPPKQHFQLICRLQMLHLSITMIL